MMGVTEFLSALLRKLGCLSLFYFLNPSGVFADYYWVHTAVGGHFEGPLEACVGYVAIRELQFPEYKYVYVGVREKTPPIWSQKYCITNIYARKSGAFQRKETALVAVQGTGCGSTAVLNPNSGKCEISPPDTGKLCADQSGATPGNPRLVKSDGSCTELTKSPSQAGLPDEPIVCPVDGNPINFAVGNKIQTELDFKNSGGSLVLTRFYNSMNGHWRHNFSTNLRIGTTFITLVMEDGRELYFNVLDGVATSTTGSRGSLKKTAGLWGYTAYNNTVYSFDAAGRLIRVDFPTGRFQKLTYANNKITIKDSSGNSISLTEDYLHQVLTFTGLGTAISYSYSSYGYLKEVEATRGAEVFTRKYLYEDARDIKLLTGITDERGVRYATWAYDEAGRAISSEHANGAKKIVVSYNSDGSSTVVNEFGKSTTYRFETIQGIKRITSIEGEPSANCPSSNSTFSYNDRGQVLTKTDAKGFITTYTYNDRGLETTRTEAIGTPQARTTATTWHDTFNLPLMVTEPGQVTNYTYDAQGRQTSRMQRTR